MGPLGSNCSVGLRRNGRAIEVSLRRTVPVTGSAQRTTEAYQSQVGGPRVCVTFDCGGC